MKFDLRHLVDEASKLRSRDFAEQTNLCLPNRTKSTLTQCIRQAPRRLPIARQEQVEEVVSDIETRHYLGIERPMIITGSARHQKGLITSILC